MNPFLLKLAHPLLIKTSFIYLSFNQDLIIIVTKNQESVIHKNNKTQTLFYDLSPLNKYLEDTQKFLSYIMKKEQEIDLQASPKTVKSTKNNFQITLNLYDQSESPSVHIQAVNPLSIICYQLQVTQEFIEKHEALFYFFDSPREFMHHLSKTFQEAKLSEEGELSMNIVVGDIIRKHKSIKLQLQKKELDKEVLLSLELKTLREQFREYRAENQHIIVELRKQNSELKESMEKVLTNFMLQISSKSKSKIKRCSNTRGVKTLIETFKKRQKIQMLCSHLDNPDKVGFREYVVEQGVKVVHARQGWDCYISRYPIKKSISFSLRDIRLADKTFNLGLGTRQAFARCEYEQQYIVIYDFQGQNLTIDGRTRKIPFVLQEHSQIVLIYDDKQGKVVWSCENKYIAQALLPQRMQEKQLFLIIQVFDDNDEFFLTLA